MYIISVSKNLEKFIALRIFSYLNPLTIRLWTERGLCINILILAFQSKNMLVPEDHK